MPCAWRRSLPKAGPCAGLCKGPPVSLEFDLDSYEACMSILVSWSDAKVGTLAYESVGLNKGPLTA
jgi:hypothetical protein